ncbi:MAG: hypothetical protein NTW49_09430 [Bacteroidia bacterium]|nr:hypothetical protein [Bacteroidia bacterium]
MENTEEKKECTCEPGCCDDKPKKGGWIKKLIFVVVVVAALGIIAFKVYDNKTHKCCDSANCKTDTVKSECCKGGSSECKHK